MQEGINSQITGSQGLGFALPVTNDPAQLTADEVIFQSSIQTSQQSAKEHERDPAVPFLPPLQFPLVNISFTPAQFQQVMLDSQQKSINTILDTWSKGVEQLKQDNLDDYKRRVSTGLDRLNASAVSGAVEGNKTVTLASTTALMMVATTVVAQVGQVHVVSPGTVPGTSLIQDLSNVGFVNMIPSDMRAELGLIGALFAAATFYPAMSATLGQAGVDGTNIDMEFAKNYAKQIAKLVQSPEFANFATLAVQGAVNGTAAEQKTAVSLMKITMLMTALALIYYVEAGHVTGADIKGMLDGTTKLPENDPRQQLIQMINAEFGVLGTNAERLKESFYRYFDTNEKGESKNIEDILKPGKLIKEALANHDYERVGQTRT